MKVLTIKQPFLDLILAGEKTVEIRTWRTKYRGELYLHASKVSDMISLKKYKESFPNESQTGKILGKCNLIDCIKLTKEKIDTLNKQSSVYKIDDKYIDYYGWVITNPQKIRPISTKGKLSIWEY